MNFIVQRLFYSHLSEFLQLNSKGSHLSVVHGMTGQYLVNRSDSMSNAFEQLKNYTDSCKNNI